MKVLRTKLEVAAWADEQHKNGLKIGLVPTMGYLHEGHLSLMRIARENSDAVIVSVFVNPTQFGPNEDFEKYPRDEKRDLALCEAEGVAAVFAPNPKEMYCYDSSVVLQENRLSKVMCGISRPIHFSGVLTVVNKLFNISRADVAVFGQKDAQQLAIIRRMVRDLDMPIKLIGAPIVREPDNLAMSSRNTYLSSEDRAAALNISKTLLAIQSELKNNTAFSAAQVKQRVAQGIEGGSNGYVKLEYVAVVDADTLEERADNVIIPSNTLIAIAAQVGKTRLIDNVLI
jgi:pantoate--beta-alanine ligase